MLSLRGFRNLGSQELDFPEEGVAVVGENAQGKSNLLEAIHYLEFFRSFRQARDEHMVAFDSPLFRVEATFHRPDGVSSVAAAYRKSDKRKKVFLDGIAQDRFTGAVGRLGAVTFSPGDAVLVGGGPGARRRFLDIVLSLNSPGYLTSAQEYRRALAQRNAALRSGHSEAAVCSWDSALAAAGAKMALDRSEWVGEWSPSFVAYYEHISGGASASMSYRPGLPGALAAELAGAELSDWAEGFKEILRGSIERDRRLGSTQSGPHRDDLRLGMAREGDEAPGPDRPRGAGTLALQAYGSGGQRRTAALALRLVEARTVRKARGSAPVILLDDVFAELDEGRSERVLSALEAEEFGQVVLTAPKADDVRFQRLDRWTIEAGRVST